MNTQTLFITGMLLILGGILLVVFSTYSSERSSMAVGGFIGPIPFGFMNTPWGWAIGVFLFAVLLLWSLLRNG
jgi:uncharacterized membrane protein